MKEQILAEIGKLNTQKEELRNNIELSFVDVEEWARQKHIIEGKLEALEWCLNLGAIDQFEKTVLTDFLDFLLKEQYCDADVYCEPPTVIDQYLIFNKQKTKS